MQSTPTAPAFIFPGFAGFPDTTSAAPPPTYENLAQTDKAQLVELPSTITGRIPTYIKAFLCVTGALGLLMGLAVGVLLFVVSFNGDAVQSITLDSPLYFVGFHLFQNGTQLHPVTGIPLTHNLTDILPGDLQYHLRQSSPKGDVVVTEQHASVSWQGPNPQMIPVGTAMGYPVRLVTAINAIFAALVWLVLMVVTFIWLSGSSGQINGTFDPFLRWMTLPLHIIELINIITILNVCNGFPDTYLASWAVTLVMVYLLRATVLYMGFHIRGEDATAQTAHSRPIIMTGLITYIFVELALTMWLQLIISNWNTVGHYPGLGSQLVEGLPGIVFGACTSYIWGRLIHIISSFLITMADLGLKNGDKSTITVFSYKTPVGEETKWSMMGWGFIIDHAVMAIFFLVFGVMLYVATKVE